MTLIKRHLTLLAVALTCLGAGAALSAIASAGAATTPKAAARTAVATRAPARWRRIPGVHGELVVSTRSGFRTVTFDRGFVESVTGSTLRLREGTRTATYRTLSLTIPSSARVRNHGHRAALSSLTPGEHVFVAQGPVRTWVIARPAR
jgi:hypothetical protein